MLETTTLAPSATLSRDENLPATIRFSTSGSRQGQVRFDVLGSGSVGLNYRSASHAIVRESPPTKAPSRAPGRVTGAYPDPAGKTIALNIGAGAEYLHVKNTGSIDLPVSASKPSGEVVFGETLAVGEAIDLEDPGNLRIRIDNPSDFLGQFEYAVSGTRGVHVTTTGYSPLDR